MESTLFESETSQVNFYSTPDDVKTIAKAIAIPLGGLNYMGFWMNELYHHGILGQKWGVRRYQNFDRTLTPEGKIRYSKNPANAYRNKYGEENEYGKARSEARWKKFEEGTTIGDNGLRTHDSIYAYSEREENRVKSLFENSPDPKMRDPQTIQKVQKMWNNALFDEYESRYDSLKKTKEYKNWQAIENQIEKTYEKTKPAWNKYRSTWGNDKERDRAYEEYKNSKWVKELDRLHDESHVAERKLGGMLKMRTMNEIMRSVTPELRNEVYDMMSDFWYYD